MCAVFGKCTSENVCMVRDLIRGGGEGNFVLRWETAETYIYIYYSGMVRMVAECDYIGWVAATSLVK